MAGITLEQAQRNLNAWMEASIAVATSSQAYEIDTGSGRRSLTRVNAEHISKYSYPRQQRGDHRSSGVGLLANRSCKWTNDVVAGELPQHAGRFDA